MTSESASAIRIPTLRQHMPAEDEYERTTCYEAGYLVTRNAGWRSVRPVIDLGKCTGCLRCYMHCPDGSIRKTDAGRIDAAAAAKRDEAAIFVDLDFCKGCGICARECPADALTMVPESEA